MGIILNWTVNKLGGSLWIGFVWLSLETIGDAVGTVITRRLVIMDLSPWI
jgi:hypothetical protein